MESIRYNLIKFFDKFKINEIEYYSHQFVLNIGGDYYYTHDIQNYIPVYMDVSENKEFAMTRTYEIVALHIPSLRHKHLYHEEVDEWFMKNTTICEMFND